MKFQNEKPEFQQRNTIWILILISYEFTMLGCAEGWTYHSAIHQMQWEKARQWCQNHYTDMVAIQNQKENEHLNKVFPKVNGYYWIGIRKLNGTWIWVGTNKTLSQEAENWAKGEPNDRQNEDCVEMYIQRDSDVGKWNDEPCTKQKTALCYKAQCNQSTCSGHGECTETINNYTCNCEKGFNGKHCQNAVKCDTLSEPDHSIITCSDQYGSFSYNSTCQFHCSEGFALNGSSMVTCNSSGHWTESIPTCTAVKCDTLSEPDHSIITCSDRYGSFSYNSTCQFHCSEGFALNGSSTVTCNSSGHWTEPIPTCTAVKCDTLSEPDHSIITCSDQYGSFIYNSTCQFHCSEGFALNGSSTVTCNSSGHWTEPIPTCTAVKCDTLSEPDHSIITCSDRYGSFSYNSTCQFHCSEGFALNGSSMVTCNSSGHWTEPIPTCTGVKFEDPSKPSQIIINPDKFANVSFNSTCTSACLEVQSDLLYYSHLTMAVVGASILAVSLIIFFLLRRRMKKKKHLHARLPGMEPPDVAQSNL